MKTMEIPNTENIQVTAKDCMEALSNGTSSRACIVEYIPRKRMFVISKFFMESQHLFAIGDQAFPFVSCRLNLDRCVPFNVHRVVDGYSIQMTSVN